jgi:hypothetical protein
VMTGHESIIFLLTFGAVIASFGIVIMAGEFFESVIDEENNTFGDKNE